MSDPALGLLMLTLIVIVIMMGFATAFTLMGLGIIFGFIAFYDPAQAGSKVGRGSYQWDGAAGTWFWIDPENDLLYVGLIQRMSPDGGPHMHKITQDLIAEAIG